MVSTRGAALPRLADKAVVAETDMMERTMIGRRSLLGTAFGAVAAGVLRAGPARGQAANQWFAITGDDGHPVPNLRVPVELGDDIEELPGAIWGGRLSAAVTLVEFYDLNCPWCRGAAKSLDKLMGRDKDIRVGLVNNPILSPGSAQAAKVQLAVLRLKGAGAAHAMMDRLFASPGRIDGPRALEAAAAMGLDRAETETLADGEETRAVLGRQMRLAASLGLVATPSYVIGGAAVLGWPGAKTLGRIVANARACGTISC